MFEDEFDLDDSICYLNHAAVSPWPQRSVQAVREFAAQNGHTGALNYPAWLDIERQTRERLRQLINAASSDEIALLKNTSEGLSIVAYGLDWRHGDEIVISDQEFPSNRIVWESLADAGVKVVEVDLNQAADPEQALLSAFTPRTRLLSVSSVQYAGGLALELEKLGVACRRHGVTFCVDAIQSIGVKPLDVQACQADFVVADGHKWMLGPEGVALFYCCADWIPRLHLQQYGWHMVEDSGNYASRAWRPATSARRFECGSPNMLGIHALHASLGLLLEVGVANIFQSVSSKIQYLIDILKENDADILSELEPERRAGIVTFRLPPVDTEALYGHLQGHAVICALRGGGIRFSPHFYTPHRVLQRAAGLALDYRKLT
jgi:selenocysteine lyase/cysteine desulfurase